MHGLRYLAVCFFCSIVAVAQPTGVTVTGSTPTQVILRYRAPDFGECSVTAVNTSDPSATVYDLDGSKFPNANSDGRHTWNVGVLDRVVVIGKRTSERAVDGKLYSRALEADAPYSVSVSCGGQAVTLNTQTDWLPAGDLFPENPPFSQDGFGNYAWPTIDWSDRSRPYIDPRTGVKLKFASFPGDWANRTTGLFGSDFWVDWSGSKWTSAQNAPSGTTARLASYTGFGNEALFVGVDPATASAVSGGWGRGTPPFSVDDFGVHVVGFGTADAAVDRAVSICLSVDSGQSCATDSFTVELPQNVAADTGVRPASFPSPMFAGWGKAIDRSQLPTLGVVGIDGNRLTLTGDLSGNTFFSSTLKPGSKLWVKGSAPQCPHNLCTVNAVQDGSHLTLAESLTLVDASAATANFGVRVVKPTPTGSVSLSLSYENAWSVSTQMPFSGGTEMCSHIPVRVTVDATGAPLPNGQTLTGYNCTVNGNWYWISTDTGESRLLSVTNPPVGAASLSTDSRDAPSLIQAPPGVMMFDATQPNVGYTYARLASGGNALFRLTYTGDYRAFSYNYPRGRGGELPTSVSDKVTWLNISPASQGKDLMSQIRTRVPAYDESRYGPVSQFLGISGDFGVFLRLIGGQDTPCWVFLYNLKAQALEYGFNTWDGTFHPTMRWQGCHSGGAGAPLNTAAIANKPIYARTKTSNYGGPFETKVAAVLRSNDTFDSNTSVAPDADGSYQAFCPGGLSAQYEALTGTSQCVTIRVAGEPCSSFATPSEVSWSPCPRDPSRSMLQTMEVGDYVTEVTAPIDNERLIIVKKTVISPTDIELVLQRVPGPYCGILAAQRVHKDGWVIQMAASGPTTCEGGLMVVDIPGRNVYLENRFLLNGHFDLGAGTSQDSFALVGQGGFQGKPVYAIRDNTSLAGVGQPATQYVTMDPNFSGVNGLPMGALQSYASKHQWTAVGERRRWFLDFRHLNGPYGYTQDSQFTLLGSTTVTLVAGTSHVYKVNIQGDVRVKKIPLLGLSGRFLMAEKSSANLGDTLTDEDAYRFCYAYRDGECRQNAKVGEAFVSVPSATLTGYCQAGQLARNIPCLMTPHPLGAWAVQIDTTELDLVGTSYRRLTMGFMGPGRQYAYGNLRALPDGKWALMSGWWIDGLRHDVLLVKLPELHGNTPSTMQAGRRRAGVNRAAKNELVDVDVQVGPVPGAVQAVVDFGYEENGPPTAFLCTPRAERCHTVSSAANAANPFVYTHELSAGAACENGCTLRIAAIASRVLYYQIRYLDAGGTTVQTSPIQIRTSSEERFASGTVAVPR